MTTPMHKWIARAARGTFTRALVLLLATLGVLAMTATPTAAQSLKRGPVMIETHHTDLAGNIRLSTNEAGDVTQRLDYAPFGEVDGRSCTGDGDPTRSPQFQGKLRDPRTCLDDFGARDYYMVTGRFQSVDPVLPVETALRDPQQWNRYAYARNNPLSYTDPDGRQLLPLANIVLQRSYTVLQNLWTSAAAWAGQIAASPIAQSAVEWAADVFSGAQLGPLSTLPNQAVFYSGLGESGEAIAKAWATKNGGRTLEQAMESVGMALPDFDRSNPASVAMWEKASVTFANAAQGTVRMLHGDSMGINAIWRREYEALKANSKVTSIIAINLETGEEIVLWAR